MGVKDETRLQERIQTLIKKRGGYVVKNHGDMISEPGIADLTICYKGLYIAMEVKVGSNTPSKHQGIHARAVIKAGGISIVVWDTNTVENLLDNIDLLTGASSLNNLILLINKGVVDNGSEY